MMNYATDTITGGYSCKVSAQSLEDFEQRVPADFISKKVYEPKPLAKMIPSYHKNRSGDPDEGEGKVIVVMDDHSVEFNNKVVVAENHDDEEDATYHLFSSKCLWSEGELICLLVEDRCWKEKNKLAPEETDFE